MSRLKIKRCNHDPHFTICTECQKINKINEPNDRIAELEAQLAAVRKEYMSHVKADKTPVMALDAIGWILKVE